MTAAANGGHAVVLFDRRGAGHVHLAGPYDTPDDAQRAVVWLKLQLAGQRDRLGRPAGFRYWVVSLESAPNVRTSVITTDPYGDER